MDRILPGPAEAMCSPISYSLVTGFPGKTSLIVETVEKTVEDTDDCKVDLNLFNTSMFICFDYSVFKSAADWQVSQVIKFENHEWINVRKAVEFQHFFQF